MIVGFRFLKLMTSWKIIKKRKETKKIFPKSIIIILKISSIIFSISQNNTIYSSVLLYLFGVLLPSRKKHFLLKQNLLFITKMLRTTKTSLFAPFKLPPKSLINPNGSRRVPVTVPTPISGEVGGQYGVSIQYSDELSRGSTYEERMARSTYSTRMEENQTLYPMSAFRPGELDPRYLPSPYPDPIKNRPLLEVGEPDEIPREMKVPVIFLCDVKQEFNSYDEGAKSSDTREEETVLQARQNETHYVNQSFMRRKLQPQRLAVYATPENYKALGLPVRDLKIHAELPRSREQYEKLRSKQLWDNERWRFSFEMLFRKYDQGPPELVDDLADDWDGNEELSASVAGAGGKGAAAGGKAGPTIKRKARKVKLF